MRKYRKKVVLIFGKKSSFRQLGEEHTKPNRYMPMSIVFKVELSLHGETLRGRQQPSSQEGVTIWKSGCTGLTAHDVPLA